MMSNPLFWSILVGVCVLYVGFRILLGRSRFKEHLELLEEEGILRSQHWVLTRVNFPLVKRITFSHVYLSGRRLMLFHALTRGKRLQAPLGPRGQAGKEEGRFEKEGKGEKSILSLKAKLWGGGRIRMHVKDAQGWLDDIKAQGS